MISEWKERKAQDAATKNQGFQTRSTEKSLHKNNRQKSTNNIKTSLRIEIEISQYLIKKYLINHWMRWRASMVKMNVRRHLSGKADTVCELSLLIRHVSQSAGTASLTSNISHAPHTAHWRESRGGPQGKPRRHGDESSQPAPRAPRPISTRPSLGRPSFGRGYSCHGSR